MPPLQKRPPNQPQPPNSQAHLEQQPPKQKFGFFKRTYPQAAPPQTKSESRGSIQVRTENPFLQQTHRTRGRERENGSAGEKSKASQEKERRAPALSNSKATQSNGLGKRSSSSSEKSRTAAYVPTHAASDFLRSATAGSSEVEKKRNSMDSGRDGRRRSFDFGKGSFDWVGEGNGNGNGNGRWGRDEKARRVMPVSPGLRRYNEDVRDGRYG